MNPVFNFTRVPETKTRVKTQVTSIVQGANTLVLMGKMAAAGSTAVAYKPVSIANFGDPVAALAEVITLFGTGSELGGMVVAAINGVLLSDIDSPVFPPIVCLPLASTDTNAAIATTLAANLTLPMPHVAIAFAAEDATALNALKTHLALISGEGRGRNGQFGSFGYAGTLTTLGSATPVGVAAASEFLVLPWLRDGAGTPANTVGKLAAAFAAVCAANGRPYNPLNDVIVGGVAAPASASDYHTPGDTGTEALGLDAGLVPLMVGADGLVRISRTVTAKRTVSAAPDAAYFDMQDYQVLYDYRLNCYVAAQQPQFKRVKASNEKAAALNSQNLNIAKDFETLGMFQHVDKLADQFTWARSVSNRSAFVFSAPVNVVPGFHNKGVEIVGNTLFDSLID